MDLRKLRSSTRASYYFQQLRLKSTPPSGSFNSKKLLTTALLYVALNTIIRLVAYMGVIKQVFMKAMTNGLSMILIILHFTLVLLWLIVLGRVTLISMCS